MERGSKDDADCEIDVYGIHPVLDKAALFGRTAFVAILADFGWRDGISNRIARVPEAVCLVTTTTTTCEREHEPWKHRQFFIDSRIICGQEEQQGSYRSNGRGHTGHIMDKRFQQAELP